MSKPVQSVDAGRHAMHTEAAAIRTAADRLDASFERAVTILLGTESKLIFCGIGKSGHVAGKLAATFSSIGIPSVFMHAAEAIHGDLGVYRPGDTTIVLSKSGSTDEVLRLMPILKQQKSPIIAIVGNADSPIARSADVVLDASVTTEADSLNLMPTASSSVSLAIGDALAAALARARGFSAEQFAVHHPGGQLGRNLTMRIESVMHHVDHIACASLSHSLREVLICMTEYPLGAACIVDTEEKLLGIITDGDVRRLLAKKGDILDLPIGDCMTRDPLTVDKEQLLGEAIQLMEDRESQISVLPVLASDEHKLVGLVRLHDAYQPSSLRS